MKQAIVVIPGFRGSATEPQFLELEKRLLGRALVERISWPGWPRNLKKYRLSAVIEEVSRKVQQLQAENYAVTVIGESLGGVAATVVGSQFLRLTQLILMVTPYRFADGDDLEKSLGEWEHKGNKLFTSRVSGKSVAIPYEFVRDAQQFDARKYIKKVSAPVLFVVAERDEHIPHSATKLLYDLCKTPKEWIEIAGMEHTYKYQPEKLHEVVSLLVNKISHGT